MMHDTQILGTWDSRVVRLPIAMQFPIIAVRIWSSGAEAYALGAHLDY